MVIRSYFNYQIKSLRDELRQRLYLLGKDDTSMYIRCAQTALEF